MNAHLRARRGASPTDSRATTGGSGLSRRRFLEASGAAVALAACPVLSSGTARQATLAVLAEARVDLRRGQEWTLDALRAAVDRVRRLDPAPRALLFLGGLTANGLREELEVGADALFAVGLPVHAVPGPADRCVDRGGAWRERFGRQAGDFDVGGTRICLIGTHRRHRAAGEAGAPARPSELAGLAGARHGRFRIGTREAARLGRTLQELGPRTPLGVASHASLVPLYAPWNFGVDDAADLLESLDRRRDVTLVVGQLRSSLRARWGRGHVLHGVPATSHGQPPPRALCRMLGTVARKGVARKEAARMEAARPGLLLLRFATAGSPEVEVLDLPAPARGVTAHSGTCA